MSRPSADVARRQPRRARRRPRPRAQGARQDRRPRGGAGRGRRLRRRACARPASGDAGRPRRRVHAARATDMESTVERIADRTRDSGGRRALPRRARAAAGARRAEVACAASAGRSSRDLDWAGAGLEIEARPTIGDDRLGITGAFCAIAETGTLVVLSGADTPTATTLLPDTHVAVVRADRDRLGHGGSVRADPARARAAAARGQPDLRPVAHRRHRADDRARRARPVPRPHPRARLALGDAGLEPERRDHREQRQQDERRVAEKAKKLGIAMPRSSAIALIMKFGALPMYVSAPK